MDESENVMFSHQTQTQKKTLYDSVYVIVNSWWLQQVVASWLGGGEGPLINRLINWKRAQRVFCADDGNILQLVWCSHFMGVYFMVYTGVKNHQTEHILPEHFSYGTYISINTNK